MPEDQTQEIPAQPQEPVRPVLGTPVLPKKKFNFKLVAFLLIAILLVAGGVYAWIQVGNKQIGGLLTKQPPHFSSDFDSRIARNSL